MLGMNFDARNVPILMLEMNFSAYNLEFQCLQSTLIVPKSKLYELKTSLT